MERLTNRTVIILAALVVLAVVALVGTGSAEGIGELVQEIVRE